MAETVFPTPAEPYNHAMPYLLRELVIPPIKLFLDAIAVGSGTPWIALKLDIRDTTKSEFHNEEDVIS